jgi:hypothetical protein
VLEAAFGVAALLVADDDDAPPVEIAEAGDDCGVLGKFAIAGERREFLDELADVVVEMRAIGMTSDLGLLPRRQPRVDLLQRLGGFGLETADILADGDGIALLLK